MLTSGVIDKNLHRSNGQTALPIKRARRQTTNKKQQTTTTKKRTQPLSDQIQKNPPGGRAVSDGKAVVPPLPGGLAVLDCKPAIHTAPCVRTNLGGDADRSWVTVCALLLPPAPTPPPLDRFGGPLRLPCSCSGRFRVAALLLRGSFARLNKSSPPSCCCCGLFRASPRPLLSRCGPSRCVGGSTSRAGGSTPRVRGASTTTPNQTSKSDPVSPGQRPVHERPSPI